MMKAAPLLIAMFMAFALFCYVTTSPFKTAVSYTHTLPSHAAAAASSGGGWWFPDVGNMVSKQHRRLQSCSSGCRCGCCGGICNACCQALNRNVTV